MRLEKDVTSLPGVGKIRAEKLNKLGIYNLSDLLMYYPRRYEDRTSVYAIAEAPSGETACVCAAVTKMPYTSRIRKGLELTKVSAADDSGSLDITFFNQSYIKSSLEVGKTYIFCGKIEGLGSRRKMTNPDFEPEEKAGSKTMCIVPRYRLTAGISSGIISSCVRAALDIAGSEMPAFIPESIEKKYSLAPLRCERGDRGY